MPVDVIKGEPVPISDLKGESKLNETIAANLSETTPDCEQTLLLTAPLASEAQLEALVYAYSPALLRYCRGILCSEADAEDAVQLTFIKAWRARAYLKPKQPLQPWLYKIAYHTAIDLLRARKREQTLTMPRAVESGGLSEQSLAALQRLSPFDRALVLGRAVDELSYAELATVLDRPEAYLRTRYARAKKRLAAALRP